MAKREEESKVVASGGIKLCIKLKIPSEGRGGSCGGGGGSDKATSEDPLKCMLCGKRFGSPKALCGHMRVHSQDQGDSMKEVRQELADEVGSYRGSELSCDEMPQKSRACRKKFPSRKLIDGQVQPLIEEVEKEPVIDYPRDLFIGWSVTGKRGRRSSESITSGLNSASLNSTLVTRGPSEEGKDASPLILMSNQESASASLDLPCDDIPLASGGDKTGNRPITEVKTEILPEQNPPDDPRVKAEEASARAPCTSTEDKTPKRKATELDGTSPDRRAKKTADGSTSSLTSSANYSCIRCHRSFATFQALGGHRSSCNKAERKRTSAAATTQATEVNTPKPRSFQLQAPEAIDPGTCSCRPQLDLSLSLKPYSPVASTDDDININTAVCNCKTESLPDAASYPTNEEDPDDNEGKTIKFLN